MRIKILKLLKSIISENVDINISVPEEEQFGHYSTNVAFRLAAKRGRAPNLLALDIIHKLEKAAPKGFFEKIEIAGNGFINFWLADEVFQKELKEILKNKEKYGKKSSVSAKGHSTPRVSDSMSGSASGGKGQMSKVQVEFVSANPTGPLTSANGRGGFLGDVISNVLEFSGLAVEREYYVNDTGNQILTLGKSFIVALGFPPEANPPSAENPKQKDNLYRGAYIKNWANKHKSLVKKYKENPLRLGQLAALDFLKEIKKTLKTAGISFDRWTSEEKDIHKKDLVVEARQIFEKKKLVYKKDNALWLKTTNFGDDKDRVIIKSNGDPTYILSDSGHNLETKERGFGYKILILGPDHHGYVGRMKAAAEIIGLNLHIIITQALRLVENGKEVKMSKRKGVFVTFEELIDEVGADVARFFFLMRSPESHMDFDLKLARERSLKNPVYYVQYAYVRAINILKKAKFNFGKFDLPRGKIKLLNTKDDLNLIRKLIQFPEIIEDTAGDYQVHRLTRYATELAREFHNFYEKERVIGSTSALAAARAKAGKKATAGKEEENLESARLMLVQATLVVFQNLFKILSISAPQKM